MHLCPLKINRASLHCSPNSAISTIYLQSNSHWCWSWFSMPTKRLSTPNQRLRPSILDATYVDSLQRMNKFSKSGSNQETFIPAGVFLLPKRKLMSRTEDDWFYLHTQNRDSKKKRKQPKLIDREGERSEGQSVNRLGVWYLRGSWRQFGRIYDNVPCIQFHPKLETSRVAPLTLPPIWLWTSVKCRGNSGESTQFKKLFAF